ESLNSAVVTLISRHEILRTTVRYDPPAMRVHQPPTVPPVRHVDLGHLPDPEAAMRDHLAAYVEQDVDLEAGPLLHFLVLRLGPEDHVLALAVHHLIVD